MVDFTLMNIILHFGYILKMLFSDVFKHMLLENIHMHSLNFVNFVVLLLCLMLKRP